MLFSIAFTEMGRLPASSIIATFPTFSTTVTSSPAIPMPSLATMSMMPPPIPPLVNQIGIPIPPRLSKKILDLEFIEMSELLPDTWNIQEEERGCCSRRTTRRGPVTDILVWLECFAALVAVLSTKYPDKVTHFMTYQRTILKAQRCFVGDGWVTYDSTYRRAFAASKSLDWGLIDFSLYNETFTGRARAIVRCRYCLSEHHDSKEFADAPVDDNRPLSDKHRSNSYGRRSQEICRLYNDQQKNKCRFYPCKFAHRCASCSGAHPLSMCKRGEERGTHHIKRPRK